MIHMRRMIGEILLSSVLVIPFYVAKLFTVANLRYQLSSSNKLDFQCLVLSSLRSYLCVQSLTLRITTIRRATRTGELKRDELTNLRIIEDNYE